MSDNNPRVTGLTLPWVLTIVFMVLKLCKVINWRWIWVFAPVWLCLALGIVAGIIYIILYYISGVIDNETYSNVNSLYGSI